MAYVTFPDLIQYTLMLVGVVTICFYIFTHKK